MRARNILLAAGLLLAATRPGLAQMPVPLLAFEGVEDFESGGQPYTRYLLKVANAGAFASDLFVPAPKLPPCGLNKNAARSWVDIYSGMTRLNGFCALANPTDMDGIWFVAPRAGPRPAWVYIVVTDRQTQQRVMSNPVTIPAK